MYQLVKVPALIHHYQEHKQAYSDIGFVEYVLMHYGKHQEKDNDASRHSQLPFKQWDHSFQILVVAPSGKPCLQPMSWPVAAKLNNALRQHFIPDPIANSLFRPPRG